MLSILVNIASQNFLSQRIEYGGKKMEILGINWGKKDEEEKNKYSKKIITDWDIIHEHTAYC